MSIENARKNYYGMPTCMRCGIRMHREEVKKLGFSIQTAPFFIDGCETCKLGPSEPLPPAEPETADEEPPMMPGERWL